VRFVALLVVRNAPLSERAWSALTPTDDSLNEDTGISRPLIVMKGIVTSTGA